MIHLALDTCVWIELLKRDLDAEAGLLEEIQYWLSTGELILVNTQNINREWNRNKEINLKAILGSIREKDKELTSILHSSNPIKTTHTPDKVQDKLEKRVAMLDQMFSEKILEARENDEIYIEAAKKNLNCYAPNHKKDSYRDTINILSLKHFLKASKLTQCYFATINYKDFSADNQRYTLHTMLESDFKECGLEYVYCENEIGKPFAEKLFGHYLRPNLPSFEEHLKHLAKAEENKKLKDRRVKEVMMSEEADPEFLENCMYLDTILLKSKPNSLEKVILNALFEKHPGYRKYFVRKLAENGLV
ncbi:hypothetical protein OC25_17735 [Pedobacter kyungheensis]|uniref:DUF4935 domain-containing protein n=1 Tax=Pedobacter kyungheensis TaxID=1069985 RepID=A0A0C1FKD6_9SPHI|nr:PIN domain-containing protein [Pedobacter kyungheensis]KIA92273.1 hypothetical protein OC25_17735 [Pedobacter kyungheensis]